MMSAVAPRKRDFVAAVEQAFHYLVREFDFCEEAIPVADREVWVAFSNPQTRIVVEGTNWGLNTRVAIGRAGPTSSFENYDLDDLLAERPFITDHSPEKGSIAKGSTQLQQIDYYAKALRAVGSDVLRGDFAVFDVLERRVKARKRHLDATK